jgi:hypothetical protein
MLRHWERYLFTLAIIGLMFLVGVAVGKYEIWPFAVLNAARDAAVATWTRFTRPETPQFASRFTQGGVTRWERGATQDGLTFFAYKGEVETGARLIDMEGRELHRWQVSFAEAFPGDPPHIRVKGPEEAIVIHGAHLFPNGDILAILEGGNFPFGGGLVKLDKDSKVLWTVARNAHHSLEVQPDGRIVVLSQEFRDNGVPACHDFFIGPSYDDQIIIVSSDGQVLDTFSIFEALCRSEHRTMLMPQGTPAEKPRPTPHPDDPTHANNVQVITPAQAQVFPMGNAGDYLVSYRELNMIAVIDKDTRLVKWAMSARWVRQHDPDILGNGHILITDNAGGARDRGRSRILEIDPVTQQVVWKYEGSPEDRFDAAKAGNQEKLPNGNVLVSSGWEGRLFEVTGDPNPRIVWEYVNLLSVADGKGRVGFVSDAVRVSPQQLDFLNPTTP